MTMLKENANPISILSICFKNYPADTKLLV